MSPILRPGAALLAILLLATPASAQASKPDIDALADQFDDFAPAEPDQPLDKLVDDFLTAEPDASVAPEVAKPEDTPAMVAPPSAEAPPAATASEAKSSASARTPVTPEGWTRHELFGMSFATPAEWAIIEEGDDNLTVSSTEMKQKKGIAAGILHEKIKAFEEFPPQMKVTELADLDLGNGVVFRRRALDGVMDKVPFYGQILISNQVDDDDEGFVVMISSANVDRELVDATALQIIASIDAKPIVKAAPKVKDSLGGIVSYLLPEGWSVLLDRSDVLMVGTQPYFSAYLAISAGEQARKDIAAQAGFSGEIRKASGEILGRPAQITEGLAPKAEVQDGGRMVEAFISSRILDTCLGDGSPIVVTLAAAPGWLEKNGFDELLAGITLSLPDDTVACSATGHSTESAIDHRPVTFQAHDTSGWVGEAATLSAPETGGIDGGSFLAAETPGDGTSGYFIAPPRLLGDWSRHSGMRISLRITSGTGDYYSPFTLGGRGDIHISNGAMNASIAFDDAVTPDWSIKEVRFDAPGWKLSGGAKNIDDVLSNITAFSIRAEYLIGDTGSGLSTLEFTERPVGAASAIAAASPSSSPARNIALATYQNARFGTVISYPASLLKALPESENGDGRRFEGLDGRTKITVYASHNALERTVPELLGDALGSGFQSITTTKMEGSRFEVSGVRDGRTIIHAEILDAANVQHVVEISMDPSVDASTRQSLAEVAASLRVEAGAIGTQALPALEAGDGAMELAFWNAISNSTDRADFEAYLAQWPNGTFAALARNKINRLGSGGGGATSTVTTPEPQAAQTSESTTPTRGTTEPQAFMDSGWWVIVGSFPTEPWERQNSDYERTQSTAARCGLAVFNDFSAKFSGFKSGYNIFLIGAFANKSVANTKLIQARKCFPDAYVKYGEYLGE